MSDFGKFTIDDPRSTNEEDPEAWRNRKGVHLDVRKITRTTHVLTLGIKNFRPTQQRRSRILENSPPMTPGGTMRRILKPGGGGGKVYILRYEKSPAPPNVLTLGIKNFQPPISSEVRFRKIHHR